MHPFPFHIKMTFLLNRLISSLESRVVKLGAKMTAKLIFVMGLLVISSVVVLGAPRAFSSDADLKKSVIEFLKQDKAFITELEKVKLIEGADGSSSLRNRRQTEIEDNIPDSVEDSQPGFFDRAAKFIVDLLQRFLKWINTDSN